MGIHDPIRFYSLGRAEEFLEQVARAFELSEQRSRD
jgi:hypothetical protein